MTPLIRRQRRTNQYTKPEDLTDFEHQPPPVHMIVSWCYTCATFAYNETINVCRKCGGQSFKYLDIRDMTKPLQKSSLHKNVSLSLY